MLRAALGTSRLLVLWLQKLESGKWMKDDAGKIPTQRCLGDEFERELPYPPIVPGTLLISSRRAQLNERSQQQ